MDDWKDVLSKRQRRRGRKKKRDPVDIFAGERLAEEDRADSRMKREAEELENRKKEVKDSKKIRTLSATPAKGGRKKLTIYGDEREDSLSRTDTVKSKCAMCGNRLAYTKYKRKDADPTTEYGRMRYCRACAKEVGMEKFIEINAAGAAPRKITVSRKITRNRKKGRK